MSFPRYESYEDSGVEWLGILPGNWSSSKIKFNTYVKGRVGWHGLNSDEFGDEGVHLVTGSDFVNGFVAWKRCYRITEERYLEDPYIQLKENDLLITKDGTIGKLARVKDLPRQASLNSGIFLVRAKNQAYQEDFLYWVLQSSVFSHFMDLHKVGSTIQHLYQEVFNQFTFPIPTQNEQTTIAAFLDRETAKIDALVAEQQRLIELLKEKRQAVISHAVTKGLNPDAAMKDSGIEWLSEVPVHWERGPLKRFAEVIDCKHYTVEFLDEGLPIVSIRELRDDRIDLRNAKLASQKEWDFLREGRTPKIGDMIFCRNASVGAIGYVDFEKPFCMGQDVCLIRSNTGSRFMHYQLMSPLVRKQIDAFLVGATIRRANVEEIRSLIVAHPPEEEQTTIASFLDREAAKFDTLTAEAQRAITLLQERRTALISAAVTGKIDVRAT